MAIGDDAIDPSKCLFDLIGCVEFTYGDNQMVDAHASSLIGTSDSLGLTIRAGPSGQNAPGSRSPTPAWNLERVDRATGSGRPPEPGTPIMFRSTPNGRLFDGPLVSIRTKNNLSGSRSAIPTTGCMISPMETRSVSGDVRHRVLRSRSRFWRPDDFEGSAEAVTQALSRLTRAGELRRTRRGLYWRGVSTPLGMSVPPVERIIKSVADTTGSGPSGWSAAHALGLSTQIPRRSTVAIVTRLPRDPRGVRFVSRSASTKRRDERLTPIEVGLLEVLRDWNRLVELSNRDALDRLGYLANTGAIRFERLIRASTTEPPRVRENLRAILIELDLIDEASRVHRARSITDSSIVFDD